MNQPKKRASSAFRFQTTILSSLTAMTIVAVAYLGTPSTLGALSFEEIIAEIDTAPTVRSARIERLTAEQRLERTGYRGDPALTLIPETDFVTERDGTFSDETTLRAAVSLEIPIGLSDERKADRSASADDLLRAVTAETAARATAYGELYTRYLTAWLAQQELVALEREHAAAVETARTVEERFQRGSASLREVQVAEDDRTAAQIALREGSLARRLRFLELVYAAGLDRNRDEPLDPPPMSIPEIPRPPELTAWAIRNDRQMRAYEDAIAAARRDTAVLSGPVGAPLFRAGFSGWDQTASAAFSTGTPSVSLSYGAPLATTGSLPDTRGSSSDVETWELSFSVALPLRTTRESQIDRSVLSSSIEGTELLLEERERQLALDIRSRYQQYELSEETIQDARRAVEIADGILATVTDRRTDDRATAEDLLIAEAQYQRSLYRLDAALANREAAKIAVATAASYLDELIGNEIPRPSSQGNTER
jgi:outer membrane protein TolC